MMTSTGALARASVAHRPPKPEPMTTTRWLPDPRSTGDGVAGLGAGVSTVITHSSLSLGAARCDRDHQGRDTRQTGFIIPPLFSNRPSDSANWPPFSDPPSSRPGVVHRRLGGQGRGLLRSGLSGCPLVLRYDRGRKHHH